ncbi:hypothetical protein RI367_003212 [Sorochytrium milnesiophthora]
MFEEAHFAWLPNLARTNVACVSEISTATMSKLPVTQMHPSYVHTAPTQQQQQQQQQAQSQPSLQQPPHREHIQQLQQLQHQQQQLQHQHATAAEHGLASLRPSFAPITRSSTSSFVAVPPKLFSSTPAERPRLQDLFLKAPPQPISAGSDSNILTATASPASSLSSSPLQHQTVLPLSSRPALGLTRSADAVGLMGAAESVYAEDRKHIVIGSAGGLLCLLCADGYWSTVEIPLSAIGAHTEVLAVQTFEKSVLSNYADVVRGSPTPHSKLLNRRANIITAVGIAQTTAHGSKAYALQIYGSLSSGVTLEKKLFSLASDYDTVLLGYIPLQIRNVTIMNNGRSFAALLVSGSDRKIHLYAENPVLRKFSEVRLRRYFPGLERVSQCVACLYLCYVRPKCRLVVCGCENGDVFVMLDTLNASQEVYAGQQTAYHLVLAPTIESTVVVRDILILDDQAPSLDSVPETETGTEVDASSTPASPTSPVLQLEFNGGRTRLLELPKSTHFESVLCAHTMDTSWTGQLDVLLGTFGQRILVYRYDQTQESYELHHVQRLAYPVLSIASTDLNQDGLQELVVTSTMGVHVFQHNLLQAKQRLIRDLLPQAQHVLELRERLRQLQERQQQSAGDGEK